MPRQSSVINAGTIWLALTMFGALAGCATPKPPDTGGRPASVALAAQQSTALGKEAAKYRARHRGQSGFSLVTTGRDAYLDLTALVALAQKTLDLQYYIWRADGTGREMLAAVVDAAERGVRVRLLLDDMDLSWKDGELETLNALPNVEVRVFNPFSSRDVGLVDLVFDYDRVNHRMHNKVFVADNSIALLGGRNVGDQYFSVDEAGNYRDLDLYTIGPIVGEISRSFDDFWNSAWSVPIAKLDKSERPAPTFDDMRRMLIAAEKTPESPFEDLDQVRDRPMQRVRQTLDGLIWTAKAELLVDRANKPATEESKLLQEARAELRGTVKKDMLLETAYLIPGDRGVKRLCARVEQGVRVRILTNSFASNDVITAYAGYRKFREPLLRCGVELYEMRADAGFVKTDWNWVKPTSAAYLHTKAAVLDGRDIVIGSFNMDPRSINLNTEIALLVRSPELAADVSRFIEDGMAVTNAYRLALEDGQVVWIGGDEKEQKRLEEEPGGDMWRSFVSSVLSLLPIEGQL